MPETQKILNQPALDTKIKDIAAANKVDESKLAVVKQVFFAYIQGQISEADLGSELEEKADLDFNVAIDFAYELVVQVVPLLPEDIKAKLFPSPEVPQEFDLAKMIEKLKNDAKISVPKNMEPRLAELIYSWFRGIRDDGETLDRLTLSSKIGGLSLPYEQVQQLLSGMNKINKADKEKIIKAINKEMASKLEVPARLEESEIDVSAKPKPKIELAKITGQEATIEQLLADKGLGYNDLIKKAYESRPEPLLSHESSQLPASEPINPVVEEIMEEEEFLESREELTASKELPMDNEPALPVVSETTLPTPKKDILEELGLLEPEPLWKKTQAAPIAQEAELPTFAPASQAEGKPLYRKQEVNERPRLEDVRGYAPKLYGPIDELASLSLIDFRRLSKDPQKAIEIIRQKLEVLENDSLEKRAAGIKALKNSPLYKIYADIMNKAFVNNQSYDQIIAQRGDITPAEYKAIMDLNKSLKY
ncbi:MAG: hypothetical protein NTX82_04620 [Candidatus Parcubacteria bacterium]|nr:hypothetical protein [Candidatus Parcubacteria bacterium]